MSAISDSWRWATVTSTSPLRVRFDGPGDPLDITPEVFEHVTITLGARVWCQLHGRALIIHGAAA